MQDTSTEGGQNEGRLWRTLDVAQRPLRVRVGNGRALAWSTASPTIRMRGARRIPPPSPPRYKFSSSYLDLIIGL